MNINISTKWIQSRVTEMAKLSNSEVVAPEEEEEEGGGRGGGGGVELG
jgi:hypothetical protein